MKEVPYKIYLSENELPKAWHNISAVMKDQPDPMIRPDTLNPITREDLLPLFCEALVDQELNSTDEFIEIPEGIQRFYRMYRPSPLVRAYCLEKELKTPARVFYKYEGNNVSGSHKLNSAAAQVYYAKRQGVSGLTTETGAGQWGTALAMACAYYGIPLKVFMVKTSVEQKPYRKTVMETYGADVTPSPSDTTEVGRRILAENPDTGGSLGCAISEAVETALRNDNYRYVLGSVLNHVVMHQSIIGLETKAACDAYNIQPDIIIGCAGGGSNLCGLFSPFMADRIRGKSGCEFLAVEPASCPSLTRGRYAYDFGDTGRTTPLMKMYTLGAGFMPSANHAGGLRFHGMSPILSKLFHDGYIMARSYFQRDVFEAAVLFSKCEGTLPAPESSHAIRAAIDEAIKCRETGDPKTILFGLSGTGYFDLAAYDLYNKNAMDDTTPTDSELERSFSGMVRF
jgi:tryptophan synthase beta chain